MPNKGMAYMKLKTLVNSLNKDQSVWFKKWLLETVRDLGIEHTDACLINIPHSHSADCTCVVDGLTDKILRVLK